MNAEVAQQKEPTIRAIISDPTSPSTIYIGTDDGIAFTHDRGNTWIVHPFATPEHVLALARDPRDGMTIWAATETGFRRSGDRGVTWTTMTLPSYRVPLKARAAAKRFHLYSEELEKAAAGFAAGRYPVTGVLVIPGPAPVVLAAATGAGLLRSTDDGATWRRMRVTDDHRRRVDAAFVEQLMADPRDPETVWAVSACRALLSRNAGATWHPVDPPTPACVTSLTFDPVGVHTVYAGTLGAGILRSLDAERRWTPVANGLGTAPIRRLALVDPHTFYAAVPGRGLLMTTDYGRSWIGSLPGESNDPIAFLVDPPNGATMYVGDSRGLWVTVDRGGHWSHASVHPFVRIVGAPRHLVPIAFTASRTSVMPCLGVNFLFSLKNASTDAVVAGHGDPICHTLYLSSDEKLDASDTPLGYEFRFEDVAPGAEYSMSASVILPLVPEGHYFVLLQPDCHPDPAADNVRSVALEIGGDPTVRVTRLEELHAQHAMGDSEYERQRSELTQWFANCATPSPMGARWH